VSADGPKGILKGPVGVLQHPEVVVGNAGKEMPAAEVIGENEDQTKLFLGLINLCNHGKGIQCNHAAFSLLADDILRGPENQDRDQGRKQDEVDQIVKPIPKPSLHTTMIGRPQPKINSLR
jgi:hypothetical protein